MIILNENTKCLVQGITGKQGQFHTEQMIKYNTKIVAGVTPGKGGQEVCGVPVFDSIEEAKENVDVNASIIFVPAPFAKDAAFESIDHLDLVIIITEHILFMTLWKLWLMQRQKASLLLDQTLLV